MVSRPAGSDSAARLRLVPEAPAELSACGAPVGTSVTVRRLFARLPARRKFLRSRASETSAVTAVVSHYALACPEVRFTLTIDGRQALQTPGSGDARDALVAVYGAETAAAMLEVGNGEPASTVLVDGLVGPPQVSRAGRQYISLFVNRRWIQNRRMSFSCEFRRKRWTLTSIRRRRRCASAMKGRYSALFSGRCAQLCSPARRCWQPRPRLGCRPRRLLPCYGSTACAWRLPRLRPRSRGVRGQTAQRKQSQQRHHKRCPCCAS